MSSTEWQVERLDLDAYLARIGYTGPREATEATLSALQRAHIASIPFENLDIILGRGIDVDLEAVQAKLVGRKRGGYCYEHCMLFGAVLEHFGFDVDRLMARTGDDLEHPRPRTHMTLRVRVGGQRWLSDVGFGADVLRPLPWDHSGDVHVLGGWAYQLKSMGGGHWMLRERQGDEWQIMHSVKEDEPSHVSDVVMANHFTSTHPSSPFQGHVVVIAKDEAERRVLRDRTWTSMTPDGRADEHQLDERGFRLALQDVGLDLPTSDVSTLWDRSAPTVGADY